MLRTNLFPRRLSSILTVKYALVANRTLLAKGSKQVAITGSSDKQAMTAKFDIECGKKICFNTTDSWGKTERSILRVKFPDSFLLSENEKYFSNALESLKLLDQTIMLYVTKELTNLQLPGEKAAWLIVDAFSGQMTVITTCD